MAAPQEYYIRSPSETEARGPFKIDQVVSLAEAGQVTLETLYYDATSEKWVAISDNADVKASVFPEKKKLTVKKDLKIVTLNKENDSAAPISVTDMLAAAEGRTEDTKDKSDPAIAMARAAKIGMWSCIVGLVLSAVGEIVPSIDAVLTMEPEKILPHPLVILGTLDVVLALLLILGVIALYPFVRLRAALGVGFIGLIYWTQGLHAPLIAVILGSVGIYLSTIFVRYLPIAIATGLSLVGMGGFAWFALTS
jgi:hypothetical protein